MRGLTGIVPFLFLLEIFFPCPAWPEDIGFAAILEQALAHSYDRQISRLDVEINEQRLTEVAAMYWPTLALRFGNEYLHDLGKAANGTVLVGDTLISGNESTYQNSVTLSASYLLYDFGARSRKYRNAERDILLAQLAEEQHLIDLKIEVLALYGNGLQLQKKIETWSLLLDQRRNIYRFTQRLVEAGAMGKLEQGDAAIAVAEAIQTCEDLRLAMTDVLEKLSYYTGRSYPLAGVRFAGFPEIPSEEIDAGVLTLPEIRAYDIAIAQKQAEYEIALRQWLPTLSLYSAYHMYGSDQEDFSRSLGNLAEGNATIGLMLNMNLFNGFSDEAKVTRLKKELRRIELEKAKKIAEDEQRMRALQRKNMLSVQTAADRDSYRTALDQQDCSGERLAVGQIIDRIKWLRQQGEQQEKRLTLELAGVERCMNVFHLRFLAKGSS